MEFQEAYRAYVLTQGHAGTVEYVGMRFIAEYLRDKKGSDGQRFVRAYGKLEDVFRECGSENSTLNLQAFAWCNDLLRKEAKSELQQLTEMFI